MLEYKAERIISRRGHVGAVASGDLEILMEPSMNSMAEVSIRTQVDGFEAIWRAVFDRFFLVHNILAKIQVNDFGATPGVISLRLAQVVEVINL